jgi:hypothetical protein
VLEAAEGQQLPDYGDLWKSVSKGIFFVAKASPAGKHERID